MTRNRASRKGKKRVFCTLIVLALFLSLCAADVLANSRVARCVGGDVNNIQDPRLRKCVRFIDDIQRLAQQNGVLERGMDVISLIATASHENGCRSYAADHATDRRATRGGMFQVDRECLRQGLCRTTADEIHYGTIYIAQAANWVLRRTELSGRDANSLAWFVYNRGMGTGNRVVRKLREGVPFARATQEACEEWRRENNEPAWKCRLHEGSDVGVHYADVNWALYEQACREAGGQIVDQGAPIETVDISASPGTPGQPGAPVAEGPPGAASVPSAPGADSVPSAADVASVPMAPYIPSPAGYTPTHPYFDVPYAIDPSFWVEVEYDISIYERVPDLVRGIHQQCRSDTSDLDCIRGQVYNIEEAHPGWDWIVSYGGNIISLDEEQTDQLEYEDWVLNCESPEVHAVNSMAEMLAACSRSPTTGCYCPYILPPTFDIEQEEDDSFRARVAGHLRRARDIYREYVLGEDTTEYRVISFDRESPSPGPVRVSLTSPENEVPPQSARSTLAQISPSLIATPTTSGGAGGGDMDMRYSAEDAGDILNLNLEEETGVGFLQAETHSGERCDDPNKRIKFCIVQDTEFMAYDEETDDLGLANLVLKFAYVFSEDVSDVGEFEVRDVPFAANRLMLSWNSAGSNVDYTLYSSADPAVESALRSASPAGTRADPSLLEGVQEIELYPEAAEDVPNNAPVDLSEASECIVGYEGADEMYPDRCVVGYRVPTSTAREGILMPFETGQLYHLVHEDKYFYIVPDVQDDQRYFFAITATDTIGQVSPSFNLPITNEVSRADAPPALGQIQSMGIPAGSTEVVIRIAPIRYDISGTEIDTSTVDNYALYCLDANEEGDNGIINLQPRQVTFARVAEVTDSYVELRKPIDEITSRECGVAAPAQARLVVAGSRGVRDYFRGKIQAGSGAASVATVQIYS
ncbi:collagen-like protein [Candidatus Woesearchaeota archaeon]|nr:collagen-like protein [Candidatus Woesearchaeota archaeon]